MGDLGRWFRTIRRYWEWVEFIERLEADRVKRVLTGKSELVETREIITRDPATQHYVDEVAKRFPGRPEQKNFLSLESGEAMMAFRPEAVVGQIAPRAAMWICASLDTLLPNEQSLTMYQNACEPKNLLIIKADAVDQHHALYEGKPFEQMMKGSLDWFDDYLK
jgi:hypothetical protein